MPVVGVVLVAPVPLVVAIAFGPVALLIAALIGTALIVARIAEGVLQSTSHPRISRAHG